MKEELDAHNIQLLFLFVISKTAFLANPLASFPLANENTCLMVVIDHLEKYFNLYCGIVDAGNSQT